MKISRRGFLGGLAGLGAGWLAGRVWPTAAQVTGDDPDVRLLAARIRETIGTEAVGLDLRRVNWNRGTVDFSIGHNAENYYPSASTFKAMTVLYYLAMTPRDLWEVGADSSAYRVAVFSNNRLTGDLLESTAAHYPGRANPIVKFNNWMWEALRMEAGLYSWDWEGSPTVGWNDRRFAPTPERAVWHRGAAHAVGNVFQPRHLADFWSYLLTLRPLYGWRQAEEAVAQTLELFSIPATGYQSPIERAWGNYIGKDGVLPAGDTPLNVRVVNDAGIILVGQTPYVVSAMSLNGEYRFIQTLERVLAHVVAYESSLAQG